MEYFSFKNVLLFCLFTSLQHILSLLDDNSDRSSSTSDSDESNGDESDVEEDEKDEDGEELLEVGR